ncbi:colon cancer-associated protein Mic1-like-domain-containing protein [Chytridium lagenaria]|nr:colon cancer-associated protein Mic1-like-domain-containing protein [Chytridium lagenaria]
MHTYVFKPISEDKDVPPRYLQTVLLEYISSTSSRSLPTLAMQRVAELQQMIATGVVPPCASVALLLVKADVKGERMDAIEMGIAMLGRLGMHEEVVEVLVRNGKTVDALRHAIQTNTLQRICPTQFLESSYTSNDLTQFLNVFRELEERGIVPSVTDMVDVFEGDVGESIVRFVSVFREIWGEVVEMEGI